MVHPRPNKRAAPYARRQTIRPSNNARRQPPPAPVGSEAQLSTPSQRSRDRDPDRMAELNAAKKPRRTRQPTEKRLPVSSPARATEITLKGGSPSHSVARPHRVAARRESARGPRAPPATRPRRLRPLEAHAAPPAHPAGTPMSRTRAAAWKTPLAQPGRGAFAWFFARAQPAAPRGLRSPSTHPLNAHDRQNTPVLRENASRRAPESALCSPELGAPERGLLAAPTPSRAISPQKITRPSPNAVDRARAGALPDGPGELEARDEARHAV